MMLNRINNRAAFTLIELLIVVAIIGILAAIAIPQYGNYMIKGFNASANADLRNIRTTEESLYTECQYYGKSEPVAAIANLPGAGGYGAGALTPVLGAKPVSIITTSDSAGLSHGHVIMVGNNVTAVVSTAGGRSYTAATKHVQGNTIYGADSDASAMYLLVYNGTLGKDKGTPLALGDELVPLSGTNEFVAAAALGWKAM